MRADASIDDMLLDSAPHFEATSLMSGLDVRLRLMPTTSRARHKQMVSQSGNPITSTELANARDVAAAQLRAAHELTVARQECRDVVASARVALAVLRRLEPAVTRLRRLEHEHLGSARPAFSNSEAATSNWKTALDVFDSKLAKELQRAEDLCNTLRFATAGTSPDEIPERVLVRNLLPGHSLSDVTRALCPDQADKSARKQPRATRGMVRRVRSEAVETARAKQRTALDNVARLEAALTDKQETEVDRMKAACIRAIFLPAAREALTAASAHRDALEQMHRSSTQERPWRASRRDKS